jgi:transketolase C-terminal domain/subunit
MLESRGVSTGVVNLLSIKPLDVEGIEKEIARAKYFITLENGCITGGVGEHITSSLRANLRQKCLFTAGFPDRFITQGNSGELFRLHGLDAESLYARIQPSFKSMKKQDEGKKARRTPRRK